MLPRRGPPVGINPFHPAAKQAQWLVVPSGDNLRDLITRQVGANTGTNVGSREAFMGNTLNTDAAASRVTFANRKTAVYQNVTWAGLIKVTTNIGGAQYFGLDSAGTIISGIRSTSTVFAVRCNASTVLTVTPTSGVLNKTYFVAASVCQLATGNLSSIVARCLDDNTISTATGNFTPATMTASGTIQVGDVTNGRFPGRVGFLVQSYDYMTMQQLLQWAQDPYAIFAQPDDIAFLASYPLPAGTGPTWFGNLHSGTDQPIFDRLLAVGA